MLVPLFRNGQCVCESLPTMQIRDYCLREQNTLWEEARRLENPHQIHVDLSRRLYDTKLQLLSRSR